VKPIEVLFHYRTLLANVQISPTNGTNRPSRMSFKGSLTFAKADQIGYNGHVTSKIPNLKSQTPRGAEQCPEPVEGRREALGEGQT
jgi:hypothetical protein